MVETLWWKDGQQSRVDVHSEEPTSEGWLVLASPEAAARLAEHLPSIVRRRVVRTMIGEDQEARDHSNSSDELVDISDVF